MPMPADIDLDALQTQRLEGRPHRTVRFKGKTFKIAPEFLFSWHEALDHTDKADTFAQVVLGEEQFAKIVALGASDEDLKAFTLHVLLSYGYDPGEAQASDGSSQNNGGRSRRTSGATTASTSPKRSGADAKRSASAG